MSDKADNGDLYEKDIHRSPSIPGAQIQSMSAYQQLYSQSVQNPSEFWMNSTKDLHFERRTHTGLEYNFDVHKGPIFTRFMAGSTSNISYNCLERVIAQGRGKKIAYKFEGNEPDDCCEISYEELRRKVVKCAAVLKSKGVEKGDTVAIYLPMILELPIAMLACLRIGAVHVVVFAGFSSEAVAERLIQANARVIITADSFARGSKIVKLKEVADEAVLICREHNHRVRSLIVVEHSKRSKLNQRAPEVKWNLDVDSKWEKEMEKCADVDCPTEWLDAEHPSFVLYTSGSTGVPKGIVHSTAGYMTYVFATMQNNFAIQEDTQEDIQEDIQEDDIYWCTADCGWITGHSYVVYGPLLNGLTSVIFEGIPTYPSPNRMWAIVEKYKVTKLYTAPTLVRSLMAYPEHLAMKHDRSSLKVIGTVGEPIDPSAWLWLYDVIGEHRAAVVDTYWQTETGGHTISAIPGVTPMKPGSATLPCFGIHPVLLDGSGKIIEGPGEGNLCFSAPWPGISRSILGDHARFEKTYYEPFPGYYFTGDGARRDEDGYYWITGRVDDLMNVSGHLLSTAEIESALAAHKDVIEAAVVAAEHAIKGQCVYAFVVPRKGKRLTESMMTELKALVRHKIGAIATPDTIHEALCGLPKTRSGKITRRILRKIADGDREANLGDTSTLIDASVIDILWSTRSMLIRAG